MKIAIFSDTFPPQVNGVANTALTSAITLGNMGHEVFVYTITNSLWGEDVFDKDSPFNLIRLPSIPAVVYHDQRASLPFMVGVNHVRKNRPDIIHTHTPFGVGWEAVIAAKLFNIPLVGTHHTFYDKYLGHVKLNYDWAKGFSWKYVNFYYDRCDAVISPSRSLALGFKNSGLSNPVEIIINPIDTELFRPVTSGSTKLALKESLGIGRKSLVYMGRVSYEKKIDQVVKGFALALKKDPELGLVIVGEGPERGEIESLVKELGISDNVLFTGFKRGDDLVQVLQANDIFITASDSENMPLSILEAMATGLPVIGANALGIPEIVEDNVNGFLFEPGNIEDMAEKIVRLSSDDNLLEEFSISSRNLSLKYSREGVAAELEKFYRNVIDKRYK